MAAAVALMTVGTHLPFPHPHPCVCVLLSALRLVIVIGPNTRSLGVAFFVLFLTGRSVKVVSLTV